jgi:hypothetical protein
LYPSTFTEGEIKTFKQRVARSKEMLEFGMGRSTFLAVFSSNAKIYSLDSSKEWVSIMREYKCIRIAEENKLKLYHVDIGETGAWGKPLETADRANFPKFSADIFTILNDSTKRIDTVFVDGRFRVACVLKSILELHENRELTIMVHDFWNRKEYHIILNYLEIIERVDRLGVFKIKPNLSLENLKDDYEEYKYISR